MTAAASAARASQDLVGDGVTPVRSGSALLIIVIGGLVEGLALGSAQAYAARTWLSTLPVRRWILVTTVVAGLGWALGSAPAAFAGDSGDPSQQPPVVQVVAGAMALGAVLGAALGAAQAWVLRGAVRRPGRWVEANVVAWPLTMVLIFLAAGTPGDDWSIRELLPFAAVTGLLAGAVLGLVTGSFLPSALAPSRR